MSSSVTLVSRSSLRQNDTEVENILNNIDPRIDRAIQCADPWGECGKEQDVLKIVTSVWSEVKMKYYQLRTKSTRNSWLLKLRSYMIYSCGRYFRTLLKWMSTTDGRTTRSKFVRWIMRKRGFSLKGMYRKRDVLCHVEEFKSLLAEMESLIQLEQTNIYHIVRNVMVREKKDEIEAHIKCVTQSLVVMPYREIDEHYAALSLTLSEREIEPWIPMVD